MCYGSIAILVSCKNLQKSVTVTQVLRLVIQSTFVLTSLITCQITPALNSILITYLSRLFVIRSYIEQQQPIRDNYTELGRVTSSVLPSFASGERTHWDRYCEKSHFLVLSHQILSREARDRSKEGLLEVSLAGEEFC